MKVHAYVLAGDPHYLAASITSYYDLVDRIVMSVDRNNRGWAGDPLPMDECVAEARAVDPLGKVVAVPGDFADPRSPGTVCDTRQRQAALDAAGEGAEWVIQLDGDEIVPSPQAFRDALSRADAAGADALDYPSRWLYARAHRSERFLERSDRLWRRSAGYPGPLAVRAGTALTFCRQTAAPTFRVDIRPRNTDPWQPADVRVDHVVRYDDAVLHFSWVRPEDALRAKARFSGHRDDEGWDEAIDRWVWRQRHPRTTVLTTPFRGAEQGHGWMRLVRVPVLPAARLGAIEAAG